MIKSISLCAALATVAVSAAVALEPARAADQPIVAINANANVQTQTFTFGIVPQQSASRLATMWAPLLHRLSDDLGVNIRFETNKDIPTFEACLAAGVYDLAYMNPVHYTIFSDAAGYRALAHQSEKRLRGLIVVRKDSAIQSLDDLNGSEVAFPSPGAFGASVVPRAEMRARGIQFNPNYVRSHDSVYRAVVAGLMPAGGGVLRTFNAISADMRDQLRIIYQTEAYTPHAIAAHANLPMPLQGEIQRLLLRINEEAPELAKSVGMNGFEAAVDEDWNDVRRLDLGTGETGISTKGSSQCPSG